MRSRHGLSESCPLPNTVHFHVSNLSSLQRCHRVLPPINTSLGLPTIYHSPSSKTATWTPHLLPRSKPVLLVTWEVMCILLGAIEWIRYICLGQFSVRALPLMLVNRASLYCPKGLLGFRFILNWSLVEPSESWFHINFLCLPLQVWCWPIMEWAMVHHCLISLTWRWSGWHMLLCIGLVLEVLLCLSQLVDSLLRMYLCVIDILLYLLEWSPILRHISLLYPTCHIFWPNNNGALLWWLSLIWCQVGMTFGSSMTFLLLRIDPSLWQSR